MQLIIDIRLISKEVAIIGVAGDDVDSYTAPKLRAVAHDLIDKGYIWLVFDFSEIFAVASPGVGVLVGVLQRVRRKGSGPKGAVNLVITNERVMKIFRMTGLYKLFGIYDNVSDAVASIRSDSLRESASVGPDSEDIEFGSHWFPARIYTSDEDAGPVVERALTELLDTLGIEVVYGFSIQRGSWFRELILRMKDSTALPTRDEVLTLMQRAIEQQVLGVPQSRIDVAQSQAIAGLLVALEKTPSAVVQSGSVLLIKVRDVVVVRNLTQLELAYWERNPGLFRDPEKALSELQKASNRVVTTNESQDPSSV